MSETETQESAGSAKEHECFCMGTGPELFAMFKKLGPDTAREHFRNARVEMLKGMRALIATGQVATTKTGTTTQP